MEWNRQTERPQPLEWLFKDYDDTGEDKGSEHMKQILAELIQMEQYTMRPLKLFVLFGQGRKSLNSSRSVSLSYTNGDGQGVVITKASTYQLPTKFYPTSFSTV